MLSHIYPFIDNLAHNYRDRVFSYSVASSLYPSKIDPGLEAPPRSDCRSLIGSFQGHLLIGGGGVVAQGYSTVAEFQNNLENKANQ